MVYNKRKEPPGDHLQRLKRQRHHAAVAIMQAGSSTRAPAQFHPALAPIPGVNSPLGTLGRLPPELRLFVYEHAVSNGTAPALMSTSRAIKEEFEPRLYDTLDLHLYPGIAGPWYKVTFRGLQDAHRYVLDEDHVYESKGGLRCIPFHKMKKTRLIVHAPEFDPNPRARNEVQLLSLMLKFDVFIQALLDCHSKKLHLIKSKIELDLRPFKGNTWKTSQVALLGETMAAFCRNPFPAFPFLRSPVTPIWTTDFFHIFLARLHKNPEFKYVVSDGSSHKLADLVLALQVWYNICLDHGKGDMVDALKTRRLRMNMLKHFLRPRCATWVNPWSVTGAHYPEAQLPEVMRKLLKPHEFEDEYQDI
ncbi:uncharacterized protein DSM5745_02261 [Aspergillus mulundensis]|uniref:Uncharacterized protein n=1 Tax=Aspergillus mulundensis TaxID=1810919 RepID=A0A3D8SW09_9EURO|nr:hypothetical protein DSM5745_02261 [Aspergillus mulundensis]RDW90486.1 hypothetical protein DSM5745_02261 [Aspergillus mulundensis]